MVPEQTARALKETEPSREPPSPHRKSAPSALRREAAPGPGLLGFPRATGWEKCQPVRLEPSPSAAGVDGLVQTGETLYPLYRWERVARSSRPLCRHTPTWVGLEKPRLVWSTPARTCVHAGPGGQKGSLPIHRKPARHVRAQQAGVPPLATSTFCFLYRPPYIPTPPCRGEVVRGEGVVRAGRGKREAPLLPRSRLLQEHPKQRSTRWRADTPPGQVGITRAELGTQRPCRPRGPRPRQGRLWHMGHREQEGTGAAAPALDSPAPAGGLTSRSSRSGPRPAGRHRAPRKGKWSGRTASSGRDVREETGGLSSCQPPASGRTGRSRPELRCLRPTRPSARRKGEHTLRGCRLPTQQRPAPTEPGFPEAAPTGQRPPSCRGAGRAPTNPISCFAGSCKQATSRGLAGHLTREPQSPQCAPRLSPTSQKPTTARRPQHGVAGGRARGSASGVGPRLGRGASKWWTDSLSFGPRRRIMGPSCDTQELQEHTYNTQVPAPAPCSPVKDRGGELHVVLLGNTVLEKLRP